MPATHASDRQLPRLQAETPFTHDTYRRICRNDRHDETPFTLERLASDLRSGRATVCVGSRAAAKQC